MKTRNVDLGILILRVALGVLMLLHGIAKLNGGLGFIKGLLAEKGIPTFITYGVLVGEIVAPLLLIIGFRARIAALIYGFNCLVALLLSHVDLIFKLNDYGGWEVELLGLYLFGVVAVFFMGAGRYAVSKNNIWD